jgi:hypothetical protein
MAAAAAPWLSDCLVIDDRPALAAVVYPATNPQAGATKVAERDPEAAIAINIKPGWLSRRIGGELGEPFLRESSPSSREHREESSQKFAFAKKFA